MFGYLQKIGKALMVPVAVLPAAAVLMGIGYWIDGVVIHNLQHFLLSQEQQ